MRPFLPWFDYDIAFNISLILLIAFIVFYCVLLVLSYFESFRLSVIDKWFFTYTPIFASSLFMIILDWYLAFPLAFLYTYLTYVGAVIYLEKDQEIELDGGSSRFQKKRFKQMELFNKLSSQEQQKHREFIRDHPVNLNRRNYFSFWFIMTLLIFLLLISSGISYRL